LLHLLDESLEAFLRGELPARPADIDISFERPDGTWGAGITRPTLNLHLWDVKSAGEEAQAGFHAYELTGQSFRQQPPSRVHFRYMLTAWTAETRDQHQLLGAVLGCVLRNPVLPAGYLQPPLFQAFPPPSLRLSRTEPSKSADFWSATKSDMRAGLDLLITASIDAAALIEVGPPPAEVTVGVKDTADPGRQSQRSQDLQPAPQGSR
jgi:hypothetical protein